MMKHYLLCAIMVATCAFAGCSKREGIPTQSAYSFTNQTDRRITLDLYASHADYARDTNRQSSYTVEAGARREITLDIGRTYWIDWYSDAYTLNNWVSTIFQDREITPANTITIAAEADHFNFNASGSDTSRSVLINGNGISSTWTGAVTHTSSHDGAVSFSFFKDFTVQYKYMPASGAETVRTFTYFINHPGSLPMHYQNFYAVVLDENGQVFASAACYLSNDAVIHTGRNVMLLTFAGDNSNDINYITRQ